MTGRLAGPLRVGGGTLAVAASALLLLGSTVFRPRLQFAACTPMDFSSVPTEVESWPLPSSQLADSRLIDNSGPEICEVYFRPMSELSGKNLLAGGTTILPGERHLRRIAPGVHDL
jgi:hypothetical protein